MESFSTASQLSDFLSQGTHSSSENENNGILLQELVPIKQLGKGSQAQVFLCQHLMNKKTFAVKIFDKQKEFNDAQMADFHVNNALHEGQIYVSLLFLLLGKTGRIGKTIGF